MSALSVHVMVRDVVEGRVRDVFEVYVYGYVGILLANVGDHLGVVRSVPEHLPH